MRVDFYQLSRDPVEKALPQLADKARARGERLLVVSGDGDQLARIATALWSFSPDSFLANGMAGEGREDAQPILLSQSLEPANGARIMAIADGVWREADPTVERTLYLFDDATIQHARETWAALGKRDSLERHFFKQQGGKWVAGP
jgi:DNA polymerase III subunit chi